jgi:hypothetical protein
MWKSVTIAILPLVRDPIGMVLVPCGLLTRGFQHGTVSSVGKSSGPVKNNLVVSLRRQGLVLTLTEQTQY